MSAKLPAGTHHRVLSCVLAVLLGAAMALSGCSAANSPSTVQSARISSSQYENGPLRVAVQHNALSIPTVYAEEKGYFESVGLDVELFTFANGAEENKAIEQGDVDVASDGLASVYMLATGEFSWIGESDTGSSTVGVYIKKGAPASKVSGEVAESPGVKGSADTLRGLTVAGPAGTMEEWTAISYFSQFGLVARDDFEFIEMDREQATSEVLDGKADIFIATDVDYCQMMEDNGFVALAKGQDATRVPFNNGYLASNKAMETRYDDMVSFLTAVYKAAEDLDGNRDMWVDFAYEFYKANGKPATRKDVKQEVKVRSFLVPSDFTAPDYRLGSGVLDVGEFNAEIGALDEDQVLAIESSIDPKVLDDAFGIAVKAATISGDRIG